MDDEQPSMSLLSHILAELNMSETLGQFLRPSEAIKAMETLRPDVAILDIEMPGMNGLELARQLKITHPNLFIIFITGYNQYALEAFKVEAIDYILKPFEPEEIQKVLNRIMRFQAVQVERDVKSLPEFQIRCFGEFAVYNAEGKRVKWATKKAQDLLAFLVLNLDHNMTKDKIGEALWSDKPHSKHTSNLHISLHRLRKDLAASNIEIMILSEKGSQEGYSLTLDKTSCDLVYVDAYIKNMSQAEILESTLEYHMQMALLLESELFAGMDYAWCDHYRDIYLNAYIELEKKLSAYYLKNQNWKALGESAERLRRKLPFDDQIYLWLFEAFGQRGEQSRLISIYQTMKNLYLDELGLELDKEITAHYEHWLKRG